MGIRGIAPWLGVLAGLSACDAPIITSDQLRDALDDAEAGDVIAVETGTFQGPFTVPAGVTLEGAGIGETRIVAPAAPAALNVEPGDPATIVRGLTVAGLEGYAVAAVGEGRVRLEDVEVTVPERGAGIGAQDLTGLELARVTLTGPITLESAETLPDEPATDAYATHGIVLFGVADASLEEVTLSGFAVSGMLLAGSTTRVTGSAVENTAGAGVIAIGGATTLSDVAITGIFPGTSVYPAFGILARDEAILETSATSIADNDGFGIVQLLGSATHADLEISRNAEGGMWLQEVAGLDATATLAEGNGMAAIVVHASTGVTFSGLEVRDTVEIVRAEGARELMVGDGMQIIHSLTDLTVEDATFENCGRVALLLEALTPDLSTCRLAEITVESTGEQLGAVMQGASAPGWDDGIVRAGDAVANDEAFAGTLDIVGVVTPTDLPLSELDPTSILGVVTPTD